MSDAFDDLLDANAGWQEGFDLQDLTGTPKRKLAVVTCVDTRIDPLGALGLQAGDAKIVRNAGARVTDDVVRSLALVVAALGVERVALVAHTDCAVAKASDDELRELVAGATGADTSGFHPLAVADQAATVRSDLQRLRDDPLLPDGLTYGGFVYDVGSGALRPVDP